MGSESRNEMIGAHVLVIPYCAQGHISSILKFSKDLARITGVTVTFVTYEDTISHLTSKGLSSSELQGLDFRFIGLNNPWGKVKNIPGHDSKNLQESFTPYLEKLLCDKSSGVAGPTSILSDMFFSWTQDVADKLQIPRYIFAPGGTLLMRFMQGFLALSSQGQFQISETDGKLVKFDGTVCIPGLPPLQYHELPISSRLNPAEFLFRSQTLMQAGGLVVNSCYEVEEPVMETWKRPGYPEFEQTKVPKLYPMGPLFSVSGTITHITLVHELEDSASSALLWLESQPSSSVLYVAFGTLARLTPKEIKELAIGLEGSEQRFLWVIPQSKATSEEEVNQSITNVLPPGFKARVGDRGCIVTGWVPQLQILAHSSVAAFLTHSGWNSSLESIMMGVPMIGWPQGAEQHLNCRYMMDHLKIATQIQTGADNILDQKEVVRAVRLLMVESKGQAMKCRVKELQKKARGAIAEGGSQSKNFQEFVDDIISIC